MTLGSARTPNPNEQGTDLEEQAVALKVASRRAMSLQQVFETVMKAKDSEKTDKIQALEARVAVRMLS